MAELKVEYSRAGGEQIIRTGSKAIGDLRLDYTDIPEDERGGTAKQLLASSVLYCFCGSLAKALEARGCTYEKIVGCATLETGLDEKKRARVIKVTLDVDVFMDVDYASMFDRIKKIMLQGCLVSASLEPAFPIIYNLRHVCDD